MTKKGTHAKMKPKAKQAIQELKQSAMLNEVALSMGVKMLTKIHANDSTLGTAIRKAVTEGFDVSKIKAELDEVQSKENINQDLKSIK